jgi:hypothetical protein
MAPTSSPDCKYYTRVKGLSQSDCPQKNALAYYDVELITAVKSFTVQWSILWTFYGCNYATSGVFLYDFDWVTPIAT